MIVKLAEGNLKTKYGLFQEVLFYDGQKESIALIMGDIKNENELLCRVHSSCIFGHYFNSIECDCQEQMDISQQLIQREGKGIILRFRQYDDDCVHERLLQREGNVMASRPIYCPWTTVLETAALIPTSRMASCASNLIT